MGTSIWLVPSTCSPEAAALQDVIVSLSKTYSSPTFPPHVTLASLPECITLPEMMSCLSSEHALELSFEAVRTGHTFYQSVFAAIQLSPALVRLHERVHKTLGVQPKTPEFAHLSLYYGDNDREEIAHILGMDGAVQASESQGVKINGIHRFLAAEVWVVSCLGRPEDWLVVEKITLRAQTLSI